MKKFQLTANYKPAGDQVQAIGQISSGIADGLRHQVLLGVTGSGKTFTMANIVSKTNRPALILAHNKTLAAQLCNEMREYFPNNRVEFFVSYYDYYQPEAYISRTDTYIEKDLKINDEIDKLRHSATCSISERRDVIVVSSVSCIYGLGAPETYYKMAVSIRPGDNMERDDLILRLVEIQYKRSDTEFLRTNFRVRGDCIEIVPAWSMSGAIRIQFFGDVIERISEVDSVSGRVIKDLSHVAIFPASHYSFSSEGREGALSQIGLDLEKQVKMFEKEGKLIEAHRIKQRTEYDMEMIREFGYCNGIENYSRYFDGRSPGEPPYTLLDYFPDDFIMFIDESHMTIPQLRAMYRGDFSRKQSLVDYGFRLPAAFDNRPLKFEEFNKKVSQLIYVSATPSVYELEKTNGVVAEQIIRPTGLVDPPVEVRRAERQVDDLILEIKSAITKKGRALVTTLTKKMSEQLSKFLLEEGIRVRYLHSEIETMERIEIINGLRKGDFDVVVGINLLREGLDIPEVILVAVLDADKEGFLRSETSLVQTIGRAARNSQSKVILYADKVTGSMERAISETNRRREKQIAYNKKHGIIPKSIVKEIKNTIQISKKAKKEVISEAEIPNMLDILRGQMKNASENLDFETAIVLREQIAELKNLQNKIARRKNNG